MNGYSENQPFQMTKIQALVQICVQVLMTAAIEGVKLPVVTVIFNFIIMVMSYLKTSFSCGGKRINDLSFSPFSFSLQWVYQILSLPMKWGLEGWYSLVGVEDYNHLMQQCQGLVHSNKP